MRRVWKPLALSVVLSASVRAHAQDVTTTTPVAPAAESSTDESLAESDLVLIEMRVTSIRPRVAIVDRGSTNGLAPQDRITFRLRDGRSFEGLVSELQDRTAVVVLDDPDAPVVPGTKAEARIPSARLAPRTTLTPRSNSPEPAPPALPWRNDDAEYTPDQPLLARVRAVRPHERARRITGRWYTIADVLGSTEGSRTDSFLRTGASAAIENAFGDGGTLHLDGEGNWRHVEGEDEEGDERTRLRLDRLSYSRGGTRFDSTRIEAGRFLQHSMPEFGVLDGFEWSRRTSKASTFGASAGFLPEPDAEQSSFTDFQAAVFGRWSRDESETFSLAAGYQKTFHDFAADRDLIVAKLDYVPRDAWTLRGSLWIDLYGSTDSAKDAPLEVTQAYFDTGRRWSDGARIGFSYVHRAFPEIERDEFLPVTDAQLADDHIDRVSLYGTKPITRTWRANVDLGAWIDEDDDGANGELDFEFDDALFDGGELELGGFADKGRFTTTVGGRASLGRAFGSTRWHLDYEFARHLVDGFDSGNNELPQHRVRASFDWATMSGWSCSAHVEGQLFDDETGYAAGFYLQRSF